MAQFNLPPAPELHSTSYSNLTGIDFSVDPSLVNKKRSPYCPNMISDEGGNPVKRNGWRVLHTVEAPVNGLFFGELNGKDIFIVHGGTKLYKWTDTEVEVLYSDVNNAKSISFFMRDGEDDKLFILTGREYLSVCFSEENPDILEVTDVSADAYIPTVLISRSPTGGGEPYEAINLLQPKRTESFLGDTGSRTYQLSANALDATLVTIKINNASGGFDELTEGAGFTVNRTYGRIEFTVAHPPIVAGQDNVHITYSKAVAGYKERVTKCTIAKLYGVGGDNRVFISGNPDYKAQDWYSDIFKPSYFPDLSYSIIGGTDTAVMGYHKLGEYLAIIKEDNQQDTTLFLRNGTLDADGKAVFSVKSGITGTGAISKHCFVNLDDEPLFLSRQGIYGITSPTFSYDRSTRNRSYFLDKKLLAENNLENAVACAFNKYYILAVNNKCYILDGRHKSGHSTENTDYIYESYYWFNIPAVCWFPIQNSLYFGTENGQICKFNFDIDNMTKFSDGGSLGTAGRVENGQAVQCQWATPNDNDGATYYFKTMQKKGCLVTLSPFDRSSGAIYYVIDGNPEKFIRMQTMDIFNFEDIDFERFTFNSNDSPQEIYFRKKVKKYKRLMIIIKNDGNNEGFGIHEIVKTYAVGNFSKNRGGL